MRFRTPRAATGAAVAAGVLLSAGAGAIAVADPGSGANLARSATVTASSHNTATSQTAASAVDGSMEGFPGDHTREWATVGGRTGSWVDLAWPAPVTLNRVVLSDRPNTADQVTGATLAFSDGSSMAVPALENNGRALTVTFAERTVTAVRLIITSVSGTTVNVGLAEFEAWGSLPASSGVNVARANPTVTSSSQNASTSQTAVKVADGSAEGFPGDHTREWATVGGRTRPPERR